MGVDNQGGRQPAGGQSHQQGDFSGAANVAQQHAGDSGDSGMFSQAIQHMQSQNHQGGFNEQDALDAHQQVYNQGGSNGVTSSAIGAAGALQALKTMMSGGGQQGRKPPAFFI